MAKEMYKAPTYVIDVDKLEKSGAIDRLATALNQDADNAFAEITILEETDNEFNRMKNGNVFLKKLKAKIRPNRETLEKVFMPSVEPSIQQEIDKDPTKMFKELYNDYTYNADIPTQQKIKLRNIMSYARKKMEERGVSESEVLTDNPAIKTLNTLSKILSIPTNALAKSFTALSGNDSSKVKIWGGLGWEDALQQMNITPEVERVLQKTRDNVPLDDIERQQLKSFTDQYKAAGFILNIAADPSNLLAGAGAAAKAGKLPGVAKKLAVASDIAGFNVPGLVGKAKEAVKLARTPLSALDDIGRTQAKTASDMLKSILDTDAVQKQRIADIPLPDVTKPLTEIGGEVSKKAKAKAGAQARGFVKQLKKTREPQLFSANPEVQSIITNLEDLRNQKNISDIKLTQLLDKTKETLNKYGKSDLVKELDKARINYEKYVTDVMRAKDSAPIKTATKVLDKVDSIVKGVAERSGLRKLIVSDVPLTGKSAGAKQTIDSVRRLESSYKAKVGEIVNKVQKNLVPALEKVPSVKQYLKDNPTKNINDIVVDMMETPGDAIRTYGISKEDIKPFRNIMDDMIIEEAKYVGSKVTPLLEQASLKKIWVENANKLKRLTKENPYHSEIPQAEAELRKVLELSNKRIFIDDDVKDMGKNMTYLLHQFTPEAKEIFQTQLSKTGRGALAKRLMNMPIAQINKLNAEGKLKDTVSKLAQELFDEGKIDQKEFDDFMQFAGELDKFQGVKLFDTDFGKLVGTRGARMTKLISEEKFADEITEFGLDAPEFIDGVKFVRPKVPLGNPLGEKFFHPDVAKTIEKTFEYVSDDKSLSKYVNLLNDVNSFWKSTTLGLYPSTVLRNIIGNITNSLLSVKSPAQYMKSIKDAFLAADGGQSYRIVTENGKMFELSELLEIAKQNGIFSSGFKQNDTVADIIAKRGGGIVNAAGAGLNKVSELIGKLPTSKMNDRAESLSKFALFLTKVKEGMTIDDAVQETYKYLFDYGDLTSTEKVLKTYFIPFYTFLRKNLPLQLVNLTSLPTRTMVKLQYDINAPRAGEKQGDERSQSDWLRNAAKLEIGDRDSDIKRYILLEGLLPQFDVMRVARLGTGQSNVVADLLKDMSPFLRTFIENTTNYNTTTKRKLQSAPGQTTEFLGLDMNPKVKNFLDDWRVASMADKAGLKLSNKIQLRPEVDYARFWLSYMLGSTIDYDPTFSRITNSKEYRSELESELNDMKAYNAKVRNAVFAGRNLSKTDQERILGRARKAFWTIEKGFQDGKINSKERAQYMTRLIGGLSV